MANTFASTANALGILKNYYAGPIVTQFNDEIPIYKHMEPGKEKWNGLQVNRPLKVRRNPGIGATSDGGQLPVIGKQTTAQAVIAAKYNYLRFGVTGPMIKASQGDKGSFVNIMSFEMEQGLIDLKNDVNRQMFWNGNGCLAIVAANAIASTVITVTGRESTEAGNKFLDIGMVIDVVNSAGTVVASAVEITNLTGSTTATLTLSAAVTVSATDIVVRSGAYNQEIQGILTSQDGLTSSIFSIDRATYPVYQGNLLNNSGNQMSLDFLQQMYNEAKRRGGAKIDAVFSDYDSERFYNKLLVADKRFVNTVTAKVKGDGTFSDKNMSYLEFAGVPWVADKDCPTRVFMIDSKTYKKYVLAELEWADESGSYMLDQIGADAYEARLRLFANVFPEKPSATAVGRNYISP
jgi:hypothetical protein